MPVTSAGLAHRAVTERISTGVEGLDRMLGGQGFFRGSSVLVSGMAGTAKTTLAASFVDAACRRGERCLWYLFEESPEQVTRNMRSVGIDLEQWTGRQLRFHAERPSRFGLETHLATMYRHARTLDPAVVVVDPITNLLTVGTLGEVGAMLTRLIDHFKSEVRTALFVSLTPGRGDRYQTVTAISSLMDTWIVLGLREERSERHRDISVVKSRGMPHSHRVHPFRLTNHGIELSEGGRLEQT
jgi:circadian clock protein KaiC